MEKMHAEYDKGKNRYLTMEEEMNTMGSMMDQINDEKQRAQIRSRMDQLNGEMTKLRSEGDRFMQSIHDNE